MPIPVKGSIAANMLNKEFGKKYNSLVSFNDDIVRFIADKQSGTISALDLRGKSSSKTYNTTLTVGTLSDSRNGDSHGYKKEGNIGTLEPNVFEGKFSIEELMNYYNNILNMNTTQQSSYPTPKNYKINIPEHNVDFSLNISSGTTNYSVSNVTFFHDKSGKSMDLVITDSKEKVNIK